MIPLVHQILHKDQLISLEIGRSASGSLVASSYFHMPIMMSVKIRTNPDGLTFDVFLLRHPGHGVPIIVHPIWIIIGPATEFSTHVFVEIEAVMAILGRRAVSSRTSRADFVGVNISRPRRGKIPVCIS